MKRKILLLLLLISTWTAQAQFKGALTMGFSGNQIDGDGLAGFNKFGLTGGVALWYPIKEKMDLGLELLYTQRGSAPKIKENEITVDRQLHLDYLEVPIMLRIKDWYIEEDEYYKAFLDLGLSTGYLFNVNTASDIFDDTIGGFRKFDFSYVLGIGYNYSKRWTLGIRYTRSYIPIYREKVFRGSSAYAYNWNVKVFYNL